MKSQIFNKKNFVFLVFFVIAKGIVFSTPILLAEFLSSSDYGLFEYALSGLGMLVGAVFSMGLEGGYPFYYLKLQKIEILNGFTIHPIVMSFVFFLNFIIYFVFKLYAIEYFIAVNIAYIVANQSIYSTILKSHEKNAFAVLMDGGVYIVILLGLTFGVLFSLISMNTLSYAIILYGFSFFVYAIIKYNQVDKNNIFQNYKQILQYSHQVLFSSFLIFFITVSARLTIKEFLGEETVGVYSYFYRISAIVVMIHQVVNIAFFTKIYTLNPKILDRYFAAFLIGIFTLSILFYNITPYILPHFLKYFDTYYSTNRLIFFILSTQMTLWIATALLSNIITRENILKNNNFYLIIIIAMGLGFLYVFKSNLNLITLTLLHFSLFFATFLAQYLSLYRKNIYFHKTLIVNIAILTILVSYLLFTKF